MSKNENWLATLDDQRTKNKGVKCTIISYGLK